jgi:hypothetical protein
MALFAEGRLGSSLGRALRVVPRSGGANGNGRVLLALSLGNLQRLPNDLVAVRDAQLCNFAIELPLGGVPGTTTSNK